MKTTFILLATLVLGLFACDDPPTEPQPFAQREPFDDDFILGRWQGEVVWGDNDSIDAFGVEFKYIFDTLYVIDISMENETNIILDTIRKEDIDSTITQEQIINTLIQVENVADVEFLNQQLGEWMNTRGEWLVDIPNLRLLWIPKRRLDDIQANERQILYTGFRAGDSLYGYVTTAGYEGTWNMRNQNIIE